MTLTVVCGPDHLTYWRAFTDSPEPAPDPRIRMLGFVADVRPLYVEANLVLVPTTVSAGTNVKVLEAMAMERAVVSTGLRLRRSRTDARPQRVGGGYAGGFRRRNRHSARRSASGARRSPAPRSITRSATSTGGPSARSSARFCESCRERLLDRIRPDDRTQRWGRRFRLPASKPPIGQAKPLAPPKPAPTSGGWLWRRCGADYFLAVAAQ